MATELLIQMYKTEVNYKNIMLTIYQPTQVLKALFFSNA